MKPILAELLTIGDEILYGQIVDTNSQWMSVELDKVGIKVIRKTTVGDVESEILTAFAEAEKRILQERKNVYYLELVKGLSPKDVDILDYRAKAHSQVAAESYARMQQIDPDSWHVHRALAQNFADLGKTPEAIREYRVAIEKQPGNPDLYEALGNLYQQVSQFDDAIHAYEQEVKLSPNNAIALYNLGKIDVERGDPAAGVALLRKAAADRVNEGTREDEDGAATVPAEILHKSCQPLASKRQERQCPEKPPPTTNSSWTGPTKLPHWSYPAPSRSLRDR